MNIGVIAVLDALGFKGIWRRQDLSTLINHLRESVKFGRAIAKASQYQFTVDPVMSRIGVTSTVRMFSDTVLIAVHFDPSELREKLVGLGKDEAWLKNRVVLTVLFDVCMFLSIAIAKKPVLVYRGCVCAGEMLIDSDIFLGPAVDEAAEKSPLADGGFVWLARSAQSWISDDMIPTRPVITLDELAIPYAVSLKGGSTYQTRVVNPLLMTDEKQRKQIIVDTLRSFDTDSVLVEVKQQNTEAMLERARAVLSKSG